MGFVTKCVKQGILAVTVEEDDREDAVDNKSLCLAGEGNGLRLFSQIRPNREAKVEWYSGILTLQDYHNLAL